MAEDFAFVSSSRWNLIPLEDRGEWVPVETVPLLRRGAVFLLIWKRPFFLIPLEF